MNTPIYDELAEEMGVHVPDPLDPLAELQPVSSHAHPTMAVEVVGATEAPPRIDDWCEDRHPDELAEV